MYGLSAMCVCVCVCVCCVLCVVCTVYALHPHYTHQPIHTYIHTTYIHTYTHTYIHTYTHTHIHTYIRIYIHTYIHTTLKLRRYKFELLQTLKPHDFVRWSRSRPLLDKQVKFFVIIIVVSNLISLLHLINLTSYVGHALAAPRQTGLI
jgi:hypothetical protein